MRKAFLPGFCDMVQNKGRSSSCSWSSAGWTRMPSSWGWADLRWGFRPAHSPIPPLAWLVWGYPWTRPPRPGTWPGKCHWHRPQSHYLWRQRERPLCFASWGRTPPSGAWPPARPRHSGRAWTFAWGSRAESCPGCLSAPRPPPRPSWFVPEKKKKRGSKEGLFRWI